jgi:hypothetical protein
MRGKNCCWIGILLSISLTTMGQSAWAEQRRIGRPPQPPTISDEPAPPGSRSLSRKMLKASYEQLQKEVQQLSDLAAQLKEQVTNTDDEDVLSLSGVKKAEEIEKLAKKIQSRMKNL